MISKDGTKAWAKKSKEDEKEVEVNSVRKNIDEEVALQNKRNNNNHLEDSKEERKETKTITTLEEESLRILTRKILTSRKEDKLKGSEWQILKKPRKCNKIWRNKLFLMPKSDNTKWWNKSSEKHVNSWLILEK